MPEEGWQEAAAKNPGIDAFAGIQHGCGKVPEYGSRMVLQGCVRIAGLSAADININRMCWGDTMKKQKAAAYFIPVWTLVFAMMALLPQAISAQDGKGLELYNSWKFVEAEAAFRDAVKANPDDLEASYYLGLSLLMQDKSAEALDVLARVKAAKDKAPGKDPAAVPDEYHIQMALAQANLKLKQNDQAWKNLELAGKAHADAADIHVYRGVYYLNQENVKKAVKELEKAMGMDEHNVYAHYYAGHAYLRSGDAAKAVEVFKIFLQLAPAAPEADKAKALIAALC